MQAIRDIKAGNKVQCDKSIYNLNITISHLKPYKHITTVMIIHTK